MFRHSPSDISIRSSQLHAIPMLFIIGFAIIPFSASKLTPNSQCLQGRNTVSDQDYLNSTSPDRGEEEKQSLASNLYGTNGTIDYTYLDKDRIRAIVKFRKGTDSYDRLLEFAEGSNISVVNKVSMKGEAIAAVLEMRPEDEAFVNSLRKVGLIEYVEPRMKFQAAFDPNDPYWDQQGNLRTIGADWAWNTTIGNRSVLVAIVDTGIDYNHPDLAANYVPLGYDWVNNEADPIDDNGHGTHCAGIIAAVANNSIGVAGLAQVRIMAEKALDNNGYGWTDQLAQAIIDATDKGANIISMSWGSTFDSGLVHEAIMYAYKSGVLLVAAAGNDGRNVKPYPAGYKEVVAVAATDKNDVRASFSNYGEWIELSAPGVGIYSTVSENHSSMFEYSGTSTACPHVAGVAALVLSRFSDLTQDQLRTRLWYSVDDLGEPGFDIYYGYGRINARKAVEEPFLEHDLIITDWQRPPYVEPEHQGTISVTIFNFGKKDEVNVEVQLFANSSLINSVTVPSLPSLKSEITDLPWTPSVEGSYNVTVLVAPMFGETNLLRNTVESYICVGFPLKAAVLDSWGTDSAYEALTWDNINSNWQKYGSKSVYIDHTTLNNENITYDDLLTSDADVLIISTSWGYPMSHELLSSWEFTDSEIEAIRRYVYEGHGLIATAGTLNFQVMNNNKLASLFGLSESTQWTAAGTTRELELLEPDHPLFHNIPNPFIFPGTLGAIPTDNNWNGSENAGGNYVALAPHGEAAIVTHKGLVYISSFLEGIIYDDYEVHYTLQLLYNAITWSHYQKQEHDVSAILDCPLRFKPSEKANLKVTLSNLGLNDERNVEAYLAVNGSIVEDKTITELRATSSFTFSHAWLVPDVEAVYNISVYVSPVLDESYTEDNFNSRILRVTNALAIGLIISHWNFLRGAQSESCISDFCGKLGYVFERIYENLTFSLLDRYDALVIGEPAEEWVFQGSPPWSDEEIEAVKTYIDSGKGFLAVGDRLSTYVQKILEEYGIRYADTNALTDYTTNFDPLHPIMRGVDAVLIYDPTWEHSTTFNSLKVVSPAYWIANDSSNEHVVVAGAESTGHILCLCGGFIGSGWTEPLNPVMFKNIFEWITRRIDHDLSVKLDVREIVKPNDSVQVNATIANSGASNETKGEALLLVNGIEAQHVMIPELTPHSRYMFHWTWSPSLKGIYNITVYVPPLPNEDFTENNVETLLVFVSDIPETLLSLRTSRVKVATGCTFLVNITINNAVDLYFWETKLSFNPSVLEFQEVLFPPDNVFAGRAFMGAVDCADGWLKISSIMIDEVPGVNVLEGALCQIEFTGKASAVSTLQFDSKGISIQNSQTKSLPCSLRDLTVRTYPVDVNHDGKIDVKDIVIVAHAFGSYPEHPRWNSMADIDHNDAVDVIDIAFTCTFFGSVHLDI